MFAQQNYILRQNYLFLQGKEQSQARAFFQKRSIKGIKPLLVATAGEMADLKSRTQLKKRDIRRYVYYLQKLKVTKIFSFSRALLKYFILKRWRVLFDKYSQNDGQYYLMRQKEFPTSNAISKCLDIKQCFLYIFYLGTIFNRRAMINLLVSNYLQLLNNKQGMMRLNLVCLMLLFILKIQCLQLQRHQEVQHDQTQVLVGLGGLVGSAFVTDKLKIVYFLLLLFIAILILYITIKTSIKQLLGPLPYNVCLSKLMQIVENKQTNLKYISSKLKIMNQDEKQMKFPIIHDEIVEKIMKQDEYKMNILINDGIVEDNKTIKTNKIIKITKKIEVLQWRQMIDSMQIFKKNQITIYGLLNYFTNLSWVDKNEGIKGGKINDPNNWILKNESYCNKKIQLLIPHKNQTIHKKILQKDGILNLLSNYNQGQKINLNLKEEDKEKIKKQLKLPQDKSVSFDEKYIYILPNNKQGQSESHGSLRISYQKFQLKDNYEAINLVALYKEQSKQINKYTDFQFDIIVGQTLTQKEYFHQLYWRKNARRILFSFQIGVIVTIGIFIGIFALKVVEENNPLLASVCRAHNLLMGFVFIYSTVWLIFAITEVNFMIYCYWNLISKKQIVLFCLSIAISSWIIIDLIKSKQSHHAWKELHKAYNSQQ